MNACLIIIVFILSITLTQGDDIPVVDDIDFQLYDGTWYNTHTTPAVRSSFQQDSYCVTSTYKVCDETTLGLYNELRYGGYNGSQVALGGVAVVTDHPARLVLFLDGVAEGQYWIMSLGPVRTYVVVNEEWEEEERDYYAYSLVSEPSRLNMFVLARDLEEFRSEFEDDVLDFLDANGFVGALRRPVEVPQGPDCVYPDTNPDFTCQIGPRP